MTGVQHLARQRLENLSRTLEDLFDRALRNERVLRRFQRFELDLLAVDSLEALLDAMLIASREHFSLQATELLLFDPEGALADLLPADCQRRWPALELVPAVGPLAALYGGEPQLRLVEGEALASLPLFTDTGVASAALLPLVRQNRLVGSLHFGAGERARFGADKSTDFIAHLAQVAAVCLENCVTQERLRRLSLVDVLTRVENRRAFGLSLATEIARARRSGAPLALLLVDLDHFKQINDRFGHPAGDAVLRDVAQSMRTLLRQTDHVCRYGGEEFALILPDCDPALALEVAERVRARVESLRIATPAGAVTVTLSVGVCCWNRSTPANEREAELAAVLVAAADEAVYRAKAAGRNCVHSRILGA